MLKVAITGNIASGKSEVQKYLIDKNYVVIDTDLITHDILINKSIVAQHFKDYDVFECGRLSKHKLSKLVFENAKLKQKLENIVHPLILEELEKTFKTFSNEKFLFIAVPLLFEVGWEKYFDKIIFVKTTDDIRLKRLMKRNNYSKEEALLRINSQLNQEDKVNKSDFLIENNTDKQTLYSNIDKILFIL